MWKLILSRTDQEVSGVPPDNFGCPIEQVLSHDQPPPSYWQWSTLGGVQGLVLRDQFVPDLVLSRRAGLRQEGGTPSSDHLRVSFPKHIGRQLLSVRVRHLGGRKKWICTMQYAYYAIRMLTVMMMMMNKRLIVVTWQSSRSPWPETIPPPPIPIVQTPYSQRIHFTSLWSSFNLQSYHCRTLFVAKNGLSNWLISRRCSGRTLAFLKLTKYAASLEQKCIIAVDLFVFITRVSNSGIGLMTS